MNCDAAVGAIMPVMERAFEPAFGEAWSRSQLTDALIIRSTRYALIDRQGAVSPDAAPAVGFYLSRQIVDEEELLLLAVDPALRGLGLGAQLLTDLIERARERGARRLHLEVREDNPARDLYCSFGFAPVGRRKDYYRGSGDVRRDAITLARPL